MGAKIITGNIRRALAIGKKGLTVYRTDGNKIYETNPNEKLLMKKIRFEQPLKSKQENVDGKY